MFPQQMFPVRANGETFRETTMFPRLQGPFRLSFECLHFLRFNPQTQKLEPPWRALTDCKAPRPVFYKRYIGISNPI